MVLVVKSPTTCGHPRCWERQPRLMGQAPPGHSQVSFETGTLMQVPKPYHTSSLSNVLPNSKWCLSKMEDPWSLASGFWDLNGRERQRDTERESTWNGQDEG